MLLYIHKHVIRIPIYIHHACKRPKQIRFKHNNIMFILYATIERYTSMKSKRFYCCVIIISFILQNPP